jgi:hypothetical protein
MNALIHLGKSTLITLLAIGCVVAMPLAANAASITFVINEVVGDPQQDWGGGVDPFDGLPGAGSVTTADEYIELKNVSGTALSLEGYSLFMDDGTAATDCFTFNSTVVADPGGCTESTFYRIFDASGTWLPAASLTSIPAGGYVVLGDPSGSMNNTSTLTLSEEGTGVIDAASFGASAPTLNASSLADEAIGRFPDGFDSDTGLDFRADFATLGAPNPVPVPAAVWLFGTAIGLLGFVRRRAALGPRQTTVRA